MTWTHPTIPAFGINASQEMETLCTKCKYRRGTHFYTPPYPDAWMCPPDYDKARFPSLIKKPTIIL